jgi:hypothetical protein
MPVQTATLMVATSNIAVASTNMTAKTSNIHSDKKKKKKKQTKTNTGKRAVRDGPEGTLISPESDTSGGPIMPEPKSKSSKASTAHPVDAKKEVLRKLRESRMKPNIPPIDGI